MPIYEYACEACGKREERIQGLSAPEQHECAACGAAQGMKRQISRAAFVLSGSGWYANGYGEAAPPSTASGTVGEKKTASPDPKTAPAAVPEASPAVPPESAHSCGGGCSHNAPADSSSNS